MIELIFDFLADTFEFFDLAVMLGEVFMAAISLVLAILITTTKSLGSIANIGTTIFFIYAIYGSADSYGLSTPLIITIAIIVVLFFVSICTLGKRGVIRRALVLFGGNGFAFFISLFGCLILTEVTESIPEDHYLAAIVISYVILATVLTIVGEKNDDSEVIRAGGFITNLAAFFVYSMGSFGISIVISMCRYGPTRDYYNDVANETMAVAIIISFIFGAIFSVAGRILERRNK